MNPYPFLPFTPTEPLVTELRTDLLYDSLAVFNPARTHRYLLTRRWGRGHPMVLVMLNPSTADAHTDDPTIRRCTGFAKREGCTGLVVLNLFALRSADSAALATAADPIGPDNDPTITALTTNLSAPVVVAWGAAAHRSSHAARTRAVIADLHARGVRLWCLGRTGDGHPRHPLYLPGTAPLTEWRPTDRAPLSHRRKEIR